MPPEPMPHGQDKMTKARMFFSDFVKKKLQKGRLGRIEMMKI